MRQVVSLFETWSKRPNILKYARVGLFMPKRLQNGHLRIVEKLCQGR